MNLKRIVCWLFLLVTTHVYANGYAIRVVQPGDSLGSIANLYRISTDSLIAFNDLSSSTIYPGDVLRVPYTVATGGIAELAPKPPPRFRTHTMSRGENLSVVAAQYGITVSALVGANPDISSLDRLPAGVELLIPPEEGLVITLQEGESFIELLTYYNLDPLHILRVNNITSPKDIMAGRMVFLPGVEPTRALERLMQVRAEENRYVWPVHGRITSYFGRRNLGMGTSSFHRAIDIAAPSGTQIVAARAGTVTYSGWSNQGYGNLIKIRHHGGSETWYAHQSRNLVTVGQYVEQGEVIGLVGSTGLSTGPHLHFELHENGQAIDPLTHLR